MYYKLRKKWKRFLETLHSNNDSDFKHQWSPEYRLKYYRMYRHYVKELKGSFEITYE